MAEQPETPAEGGFLAHLIELRNRLLYTIVAVGVVFLALVPFANEVYAIIASPLMTVMPAGMSMIATEVASPFLTPLKFTLAAAVTLTIPFILYQIWAFIMPGLTRKEVRYTIGFLCAAIPLFFAGCYAGWIVMPHIIELMSTFVPEGGVNFFDYREYYDFIFKLLLVIGVAFVLPVLLVLLNFAGVMSGKAILKAWRWAILAITLFTAMATPAADVVSMFLLAIPMVGLYFAAVLVAIIHDRRVAKRLANDPVLGSLS